jgi:hypothetical protein
MDDSVFRKYIFTVLISLKRSPAKDLLAEFNTYSNKKEKTFLRKQV